MNEENSGNKKNWLYGFIILLLLVLVFETGLLLTQHLGKIKANESRPLVTHESLPPVNSSSLLPSRRQRVPDPNADPFAEDPMTEIQKMRAYMNRVFNAAMTYGPPLAQTLSGGVMSDFTPAIDLQESDNAYIVHGDLPGLEKDKINISVRGNILTIQGIRETTSQQKDDQGGYYAQERSYGSFARTLTLPGPVDETKVKADYKDGVLTITLPKMGETKSTQKVLVE